MNRKTVIFTLICLVLAIAFIELSGHVFYRIIKKEFVWEDFAKKDNTFNIRDFTELVEDDRLVTNRKNYHVIQKKDNITWTINTDANGFRCGANSYFKEKDNIVFLGDSVPFGYGVNAEESIPSIFYNLMKKEGYVKYGVINAAIPSYSLYQAIKRYEYEIGGKFPVKYIILQVYDPVSQFLIWGNKWDKKMCWTSKDMVLSTKAISGENKYNFVTELIRRYSFIYHIIYKTKLKFKKIHNSVLLLKRDKENFSFFEKENLSVLNDFYSLLKRNNITLFILPVNPTKPLSNYSAAEIKYLDAESKALLTIIEWFNQILREFTATHKDVYYLDIISYFDKIGRDALFIDNCCHLSAYGAQKEAEFIFEQIRVYGQERF